MPETACCTELAGSKAGKNELGSLSEFPFKRHRTMAPQFRFWWGAVGKNIQNVEARRQVEEVALSYWSRVKVALSGTLVDDGELGIVGAGFFGDAEDEERTVVMGWSPCAGVLIGSFHDALRDGVARIGRENASENRF